VIWRARFTTTVSRRFILPAERRGNSSALFRDRKEDVPELVRFFLRKYARELGVTNPPFKTEAIELLQNHRWSGTCASWKILCAKLLLLTRGYTIAAEHVRELLVQRRRARPRCSPR